MLYVMEVVYVENDVKVGKWAYDLQPVQQWWGETLC